MSTVRRVSRLAQCAYALLALACQGAPAPARTASVTLTPPALLGSALPVAPLAAAVPMDLCKELLAGMALEARNLEPAENSQPASTSELDVVRGGRCYQTSRGAWAVGLTRAENHGHAGYENMGTWSVVHVDAAGARTQLAPDVTQSQLPAEYNYTDTPYNLGIALEEPVVFDYDSDGEQELVVWGSGHFFEGASFNFGSVWTFAGGKIVRYAPSAGLSVAEAKDVDGDARPDLRTAAIFESELESAGSGFGYTQNGPSFVAHSLRDGTFSQLDVAAQQFVRDACPRAPLVLIRREINDGVLMIDDSASFQAIACARVWGADPKLLKRQIAKQCGKFKPAPNSKDPNSCDHQPAMLDWANRTPPLSLR